MSQNSSNVILVDGLRASLTLTILLASVKSIHELNINAIYTRCTSCNFS